MVAAGGGRIQGPGALPIVGGVFVTIGLLGLVASAVLGLGEHYSRRTAHAEGEVVGFAHGPIVAFTSEQGQTVQFVSPVRTTLLSRGERLPVVYDPERPTDAAIDGWTGRWFLPALFGILGGIFFLLGGFLCGLGRILLQRSVHDH